MKTLVLFFDDHLEEVDIEVESRVILTVPYGSTISVSGLKVTVHEDGSVEDDLDKGVTVGHMEESYYEYIFEELDERGVVVD